MVYAVYIYIHKLISSEKCVKIAIVAFAGCNEQIINLDHFALGIYWKCGVVISFCILYVAPLFVYFLKSPHFS